MRTPNIPLKKTGWFYLWLCLVVIGIWGEQKGYLGTFEFANQKIWQKNDTTKGLSNLMRITDISFDLNGLNKIQQIIDKHPDATFAFMGSYSNNFVNKLSAPEYGRLAERTVLLSSGKSTSVSSLLQSQSQIASLLKLTSLNPISQLNDISWRVNVRIPLAIQPDAFSYASKLIWRDDDEYYPSFIGQVMIRYIQNITQTNDLSFDLNFSNQLSIADHVFELGFAGEIYPNGNSPVNLSYKTILSNEFHPTNHVILIDDLSVTHSNMTAKALANLVDRKYLTSSWLTLLVKYLLVIVLLFGIYRMRSISFSKQAVVVIASLLVLFSLQSFFINQSLWLSLSLILLLSLATWLMQLGYTAEVKYLVEQNKKHNELLVKATPLFYKTQNFEILLPHLEQSYPDHKLVDSVYEVAIEAEAHQNNLLAKQLHGWILEHDKGFLPSIERMSELAPKEEDESELDQTLVIDPDGEKVTPQVSSLLQVTHFGRYQVDGILGKGAMGVVFQGVDPKINRYVAIKTLQLSDELDGESLIETKQRFFREAETAGNLSHANIVTIYDVGEEKQPNSNRSLGYIAMDLLTGAPLSEYIKKGKLLPPSLVYQLMIQMTDALDYAHRQKVIHRDIKPANIVYDDDLQRGTLTDFGIAYMSDHSKTKTGTIIGSPYYMSPEQILGTKIDGRSDIFSLGVTFYQLLSGHLPFNGESIASVAFHITKTKHDSVKQWNKKLHSSAARITNKALQKDVNKRFQTMQEFKQALINALKRDYKKSPLI